MLKQILVSPQFPKLGGVNLLDDSKRIDDAELTLAKNIYPTIPGILNKRDASQYVSSVSNVAIPLAFYLPPPTVPGDLILVTRGTPYQSGLFLNTYLQVWDSSIDTKLVQHDFGASTPRRPATYYFNNRLYVFAGPLSNVSGKIVTESAGLAVLQDFEFTGTPGLKPAIASAYRDRYVYGNFGPGYEHVIAFSDTFTRGVMPANVLATDGRNFTVGSPADGDMVAIVQIMLTAVGSPAQAALLVLHEFAAHIVTGQPNDSDDATAPLYGDLLISRVSFNCGCASAETVVTTPYGVIWAGHDDVWMFNFGQVPQRIGSKIRPALLRTPASVRYLWHAAYYNGTYRLAIAGEEQDVQANSPMQDQWWLDLRDGPPPDAARARWWGPQQYLTRTDTGVPDDPLAAQDTDYGGGSRFMQVENRLGMEPILWGLDYYRATAVARADLTILVNYDVPSPRDADGAAGLAAFTPAGLEGTEINFEMQTKDLDYGDSDIDKIYTNIEFSIWTSYSEQLVIECVLDGGLQTDTQGLTITQTPYALNLGTAG